MKNKQCESYSQICTHTHTTKQLTILSNNKRSQSALEYMMTYGWAILIIVIVAVILYSMGIFNPSSSISATITGFSGFNVQASCIQGGALEMQIFDGLGYTVNITRLNTTGSNGQVISIPIALIISPSQSQSAFIPNACTSTTGSSFSNAVMMTYTEPGQILPGPYLSSGKVYGKSVLSTPASVGSFNDSNTAYIVSDRDSSASFNPVSISAWVYSTAETGAFQGILVASPGGCVLEGLALINNGLNFDNCGVNNYNSGFSLPFNKWVFVTMTVSGESLTMHVNSSSVNYTEGSVPGVNIPYHFYIGNYPQGFNRLSFAGMIADVQVYNISLSSSQVQKLYSEGLGGAPMSHAGLVGWWPLDGNANDYSGNNNNGIASNVGWVSP